MLEAQALHRVRQLDVDAEIVGVEFQLVAGLEASLLVHVHGEIGDTRFGTELPVPVAVRRGAEVDRGGFGHGVPYSRNSVLKYLFTFPAASAFY
jgi:hypothetical protein